MCKNTGWKSFTEEEIITVEIKKILETVLLYIYNGFLKKSIGLEKYRIRKVFTQLHYLHTNVPKIVESM